jgi:acetylornithine deacetylase
MNPAQLLESVVGIPSISGSEGALSDFLAQQLTAMGFQVQRLGHNLWFEVGKGSPRLLFVSHLDTVPPCAGWNTDPLKPHWAGESLHGLGANDAKGCVTAMILAAQMLSSQETGSEGTAVFAFVREEEVGGKGIQELLPKLGALDAAVVGEPTSLKVCTAQRGMLVLKGTAKGVSAHVAHAKLGENAIHRAARDMVKLESMAFEAHPLLGVTRPVVTQVSGGLAHNQVPDQCEFIVDLRTTPNLTDEEVTARIASELESQVSILASGYHPMATDPASPIVKAALQAAGTKVPVGSDTTSDWAFLGHLPAVKAGPGDTMRSHRPNEWVSLKELNAGTTFYAALAREFFRLKTLEACRG